MNISLNNIKITDDLKNENLYKLKVGQQFLIMQEKELEYKEENFYNVQSAFITQILMDSIYQIEGVNNHLDPYEYEQDDYEKECGLNDNTIGVEYNTTFFERNFLVLGNNIKMELKSIGSLYNIENEASDNKKRIFYKFQSMANKSDFVNCDRLVNYEDNKVEFFMVYPINNNYICYYINNSVNADNYYWEKTQDIYMLNKDFTHSVSLNFSDNKQLLDILNDLEPAKYSMAFEQFYDIYYPGNTFDIQDYIKNPDGIQTVIKAFENSCIKASHIYDIFQPIFKDDTIEFKGYFNSRFYDFSKETINKYNHKKSGSCYEPDSLTTIAIRKTQSIKKYLRKELPINVFTGEYIEDRKCEEIYRDAGGLILNVKPKNQSYTGYAKYHFTLIDGIYCESYAKERQEIEDRMKMIEKLTI